jgi:DsbC/DsbD-like thiol-disulfide interchange protein
MIKVDIAMKYSVVILVLTVSAFQPLPALQEQPPPVRAQLVPEVLSVRPGKPFWVALRLQMEEGWHTYWKNPGDSGLPTKIEWKLPPGFKAGEIQWPYPEIFLLGLDVNYGYENEAWLLTEITPPAALKAGTSISLVASAKWLACLEECLPGGADMMVRLPVKDENPKTDVLWSGQFKETRQKIPENSSAWKVGASAEDDLIRLFLNPPANVKIDPEDVYFFPEQSELIDYVEPQALKKTEAGFVLEVQRSKFWRKWPARIQGVLFSRAGWGETHGRPAIRVNVKLETIHSISKESKK